MNRQELLQATNEQILDEVRRLQYLCNHAQIIRHGLNRDSEQFQTQSVAEHVYSMMNLALYFKKFEDPDNKWDWNKIHNMILWHDAAELETGDIPKQHKTQQHEIEEQQALETVINKSPKFINSVVRESITEYEERKSPESLYVKAIDQLEVILNSYTPHGRKIMIDAIKTDKKLLDFFRQLHDGHTYHFDTVHKFATVVQDKMVEEKYYID